MPCYALERITISFTCMCCENPAFIALTMSLVLGDPQLSTMNYELPPATGDRPGVAGGQCQLIEPVPSATNCRAGPLP
jgi:hypothetical protein